MRRFATPLLLGFTACAGAARAPAASAPQFLPIEPDSVDAVPIEVLSFAAHDIAAPETVSGFPFAVVASDFDIPLHHNAQVQNFLELMTVRHRRSAEIWLGRQNRFDAMIEEKLRAAELPVTLKYLPLVESGYLTTALSHASARGLWQFMSGTAREVGMEVGNGIDDRLDPVISTEGAIRHIRRLYDHYDNWYLALAAYNSGAGRVDRALRSANVDASLGDSAFWAIHPLLPRETRDYVPFFVAAAVVSRYPAVFGFDSIPRDPPFTYDEVTVPDETELAVVARLLDVPPEAIADLNPRYTTGVTPRGRSAPLRVPPGMSSAFSVAYAALPPEKRVTVRWHVVRRGETLSEIAERYGVSSARLQQTNNISRPSRLQIGTRLRVPIGSSSVRVASSSASSNREITHRVRSGESLWTIARRYGVSTSDLIRWNGLSRNAVIHPGDRIRVRR